MGTRSATPASYYYSGQGRVAIADRDFTTGLPGSFTYLGNVTELTINTTNTKLEHQESMTGARGIDQTVIKQVKATVKFKTESVGLENLALGLYGKTVTETGASVTSEIKKLDKAGDFIPLNHPMVSTVVVKVGDTASAAATGTSAVLGTDYTLDTDFGVIYPVATSTVLVAGKFVSVAYAYATAKRMDGLSIAVPAEKWIRFEGLNTLNEDAALVNLFRCKLEPIATYQLLNDDFANIDFTGNLLLDEKRPVGDQYFSQRIFALDNA